MTSAMHLTAQPHSQPTHPNRAVMRPSSPDTPRPALVAVPDCEPPLELLDEATAAAPVSRVIMPPPLSASGEIRRLTPATPRPLTDRAAAAPERRSRLLARVGGLSPNRTAPAASSPTVREGSLQRPRVATRRRNTPLPGANGPQLQPRSEPTWVEPICISSAARATDQETDGTDVTDSNTGTQPRALPPIDRAGASIAQGLVEVLTGGRALAQLRAHCNPEVYRAIGDVPTLQTRTRPMLLSIHTCQPTNTAGEIAATFRCSGRVRALALRLDGGDGRWCVTDIQIG